MANARQRAWHRGPLAEKDHCYLLILAVRCLQEACVNRSIKHIYCSNLHGSHSLETVLVSSYVVDNTICLPKACSSIHLLDFRCCNS